MQENECCNKYKKYSQRENAFAQSGSLTHELMEGYAREKFLFNELSGLFEAYFDDYVTEEFPPNKYANLRDTYFSGSMQYLDNFTGFEEYDVISPEIDFTIDVGDGDYLHGFIDLLLKDKSTGNLIICDYKSKKEIKKSEQRHYARQLYLYSLYIKEKYGEYPKELVFILFRAQKELRIKFNMDDLEEAKEWMYKQINKIKDAKEFPAKYDQFFCSFLCNFADSCPKKDEVSNNSN